MFGLGAIFGVNVENDFRLGSGGAVFVSDDLVGCYAEFGDVQPGVDLVIGQVRGYSHGGLAVNRQALRSGHNGLAA